MEELVIFGLGELGQLYGGAALAAGYRVTPVLRATPVGPLLAGLPPRTPLLIAVPEAGLDAVLSGLPPPRREDAILLQNGIFPSLWTGAAGTPTVMVPWLLKKQGAPQIVIRSTPVFGRHAGLVLALHAALHIDAVVLDDAHALAQALADKYAFILTINALGVWRDQTLGRWLDEEPVRVRALAAEAGSLAARLADVAPDRDRAEEAVLAGMFALRDVSARGRSAASRLAHADAAARRLHLVLPLLSQLSAGQKP